MKNFKLCFLIAILFVFAFNSNSEALINTKYFSLNGSLQTYYQYYYAEGVENRDSPNTFHFNISPTFTFFGIDFSVQSDLDYYFTTDPKFYLPSFNYLSIRPNWNWGGLELMDFSPYFSDLTLNGITLRGAALDLHPGNFQLYILGGDMKADSSVVYDRRYYGMRMQIGGFSLNVVQASDKAFHLSEEDSTLTAPEENLVVGCQMAFEAWKTDVNLEVAGAAYTRDIYAQKLDYDNSFSFIEGIYTPRHSSYADIAYAINANYPLSIGNIKGAFQYVGPGYTSLGLYSSNNDQLEFEFDLNLRPHPMISFSGNYNQNRNNLLYNLVATTFNRNLSIYTSFFPASFFSNSIYYYWYGSNK
ncbi:hypothetical protein JW877_00175, partial [bacterium]|nr:hypothetical protein [bacterium]